MENSHITDILDNAPLANLSESELRTIRAHAETCVDCKQAFAAAQISALLFTQRADEAAERSLQANPFFQTRVLAAWREQQTVNNVSAFRRLWNASGALVASMAVTTAALAVFTFVTPSSDTTDQNAVLMPYSAEAVVLGDQLDNQMTNDQVLSAVYADEDEGQ